MTGWHLNTMTPFDIESGGVNVETDGVVTVTVATVGGGRDTDVWSGLIAVDFDIDPAATEVHGITTEYARANGKPAADVLDEAAERLAISLVERVPVVGMNLPFDFTILDRNCRRYGVRTVTNRLVMDEPGTCPILPVIDVLVIDKAMDRYRPGKRKLEDLCRQYGVRHGGAHDATEDALAAARVAYVMGRQSQQDADYVRGLYVDRRYPDRIARDWVALGRMSLLELHAAQVGWYREQSESLAMYWRGLADQKRSDATRHDPPGEIELSFDERRQVLLDEADELESQADGVRFDWPVQPFGGAA